MGSKLPRNLIANDERFWRHINKKGVLLPNINSRCWEWTGSHFDDGYGSYFTEVDGEKKNIRVHRYIWQWYYNRPIPKGKTLHHMCLNQACVNPLHLLVLSNHEHGRLHSVIRTTCRNGHPYDNIDPLIDGKGHRRCRECAKAARERYIWTKKES